MKVIATLIIFVYIQMYVQKAFDKKTVRFYHTNDLPKSKLKSMPPKRKSRK
ncbi:unnamed protein product [Schistosoma curassoni]|uniref:Uncharacterized protein n=1 Tax=Schistosoma curassoni TaxID=6186 RepID=A0A183L1V3_9TREM|nr:unnamed protein product [Schistosoma curassoni]